MAKLDHKTKGNSSPDGKPRVYFTCHPDDFQQVFDKICDDILKTHDCAIYYTTDMSAAIENYETIFDRINLFVIPVTLKLLTQPNRAMDTDFAYAQRNGKRILPIMMEAGIIDFYSKPDKFGERQYLNPYSTDFTEIKYEEKLKRFLDSVLLSNEMIQRIRAAFDAYVFLSYRKKDRVYANKLMRMIHSNLGCRDIAIWFDEFLTPGESFKKNIEKILEDCNLFALLVTPQIFEKIVGENGEIKDNYVISTELPAAQKNKQNKGTDIFAVEMEDTDRNALLKIGIDNCVKFCEEDVFRKQLLASMEKVAIESNNDDPVHNFLIGLAYLDGIDVEINRELALQLITSAADAGLEEAMRRLVLIYSNGDYRESMNAITWQNRVLLLWDNKDCTEERDNIEYINDLLLLSELYERCDMIDDAISIRQKVDALYETMFLNKASVSKYLYKYVQNIYSIAKLTSYKDDFEHQQDALKYFTKAVQLISDAYGQKIEDSELLIIAEMSETIAQYIAAKPREFDAGIDASRLSYAIRKMRRVIEKYNKIDLTTWLRDNGIFYRATEKKLGRFYKESGIYEIVEKHGWGSVDAGTDYKLTNPMAEAEELLIVAVGIYDYLAGKSLSRYGMQCIHSYHNVASLWIGLGAYSAAIQTLEMTGEFLEKYEKDFYCDESIVKAEKYELLADAYWGACDKKQALEQLKLCAHILEAQKFSKQGNLQLSDIYQKMANVFGMCADGTSYLKKSVALLEKLHESNALSEKEIFGLVDRYCDLLSMYAHPDLWNPKEFMHCFSIAYELCKEHAHADETKAALCFNRLHRLRVFMAEDGSIESIRVVGTLFTLALNNCKTLLKADCEYSNCLWNETLAEVAVFNRMVTEKRPHNLLAEWETICTRLITECLTFVSDFADESPLNLLDHDHRISFSDYALITGQVDHEFIKNYRSLLYSLFDMFIELVYRKGFVKAGVDIAEIIRQAYSNAITCQKQGYAYQIFNKEQRELLEKVAK